MKASAAVAAACTEALMRAEAVQNRTRRLHHHPFRCRFQGACSRSHSCRHRHHRHPDKECSFFEVVAAAKPSTVAESYPYFKTKACRFHYPSGYQAVHCPGQLNLAVFAAAAIVAKEVLTKQLPQPLQYDGSVAFYLSSLEVAYHQDQG